MQFEDAPQTKLTPMFEQYLSVKKECPGALLFYRMGDFYELFFEDAEIAARELGIVLTCRNPDAENKIPMAGVPWRHAESYISELLEKATKALYRAKRLGKGTCCLWHDEAEKDICL